MKSVDSLVDGLLDARRDFSPNPSSMYVPFTAIRPNIGLRRAGSLYWPSASPKDFASSPYKVRYLLRQFVGMERGAGDTVYGRVEKMEKSSD